MKESIDSFLSFMTVERGVSPNTLVAYRNDLNQLVEYLKSQNIGKNCDGWNQVDEQVLASYLLQLHDLGYSDTTRARKVASTKSLFNFLSEEGIIAKDPTENLSAPRVGRSLPETLAVEDVERLLTSTARGHTPEAKRDQTMLEILYATGMRVSELVSLDIDDLDLDQGSVRCFGKGARERVIPIHHRAILTLQEYLDKARPHIANRRSGDALFLNRRGRTADPPGVLAHTQGPRQTGWHQRQDYTSYVAPQLRHPLAARRCLAETRAGASGTRQHHDYPGLHTSDKRACERGIRQGPS